MKKNDNILNQNENNLTEEDCTQVSGGIIGYFPPIPDSVKRRAEEGYKELSEGAEDYFSFP